MLLYDSPVSGNCYKVRLLLAHLAIPYERRTVDVVDRSNRPQLLGGLNPALRVPTLVLDDGLALRESGAILWYFGEGTRFVPEDRYERAQVLQWMFFEQYDHEPAIAVARFWLTHSRPTNSRGSTGHFRRIEGGASDPDAGTASGASAGRPEAFEERLAERTAAGYRALDAMERHLDGREYLVGGGMTLADIALYAYTHVAHEGGFDLAPYPTIRGWCERVEQQPNWAPITER